MRNASSIIMPYHTITITPYHICSLGGYGTSFGAPVSGVWESANRALYIPFRLPTVIVIRRMFIFNGAVVNGNFDLGLYDNIGNRMLSTGGIPQAGVNQIQSEAIGLFRIGPGVFYMALVLDNNVGTLFGSIAGTIAQNRIFGVVNENNAYPLPAVATFATRLSNRLKIFGLTVRNFV